MTHRRTLSEVSTAVEAQQGQQQRLQQPPQQPVDMLSFVSLRGQDCSHPQILSCAMTSTLIPAVVWSVEVS